jgi:hypothetical protein
MTNNNFDDEKSSSNEITEEHRKRLVAMFVQVIKATPRDWNGKELMTLHRLFPCEALEMFLHWLGLSKYRGYKRYFRDEERFARLFEAELECRGVKFKKAQTRTAYGMARGEYKYNFPSFRLTKAGMQLYILFLPGDELEADESDETE